MGGQRVERGDALILGFAAANQDPRIRAEADLEVGNRAHLAWSAGPHACPASQPGWLIVRIAVEAALHELHAVELRVQGEGIR